MFSSDNLEIMLNEDLIFKSDNRNLFKRRGNDFEIQKCIDDVNSKIMRINKYENKLVFLKNYILKGKPQQVKLFMNIFMSDYVNLNNIISSELKDLKMAKKKYHELSHFIP